MKKTYINPMTNITIVKVRHQLLSNTGANANGLDGTTKVEYTGGSVSWSRGGGDSWDDDE